MLPFTASGSSVENLNSLEESLDDLILGPSFKGAYDIEFLLYCDNVKAPDAINQLASMLDVPPMAFTIMHQHFVPRGGIICVPCRFSLRMMDNIIPKTSSSNDEIEILRADASKVIESKMINSDKPFEEHLKSGKNCPLVSRLYPLKQLLKLRTDFRCGNFQFVLVNQSKLTLKTKQKLEKISSALNTITNNTLTQSTNLSNATSGKSSTPIHTIHNGRALSELNRIGSKPGSDRDQRISFALRGLSPSHAEELESRIHSIIKNGFANFFYINITDKDNINNSLAQKENNINKNQQLSFGAAVLRRNWKQVVGEFINLEFSMSPLNLTGGNEDNKNLGQEVKDAIANQEFTLAAQIVKEHPSRFSIHSRDAIDMLAATRDGKLAVSRLPTNLLKREVRTFVRHLWNEALTHRISDFGTEVMVGDLVMVAPPAANPTSNPANGSQKIERSKLRTVALGEHSKFNLDDVVLPIPGCGAFYPDNDMNARYRLLFDEYQLEAKTFERNDLRRFLNDALYRPIVCCPRDAQWDLCLSHDLNPSSIIIPSPLDRLVLMQGRDDLLDLVCRQEGGVFKMENSATSLQQFDEEYIKKLMEQLKSNMKQSGEMVGNRIGRKRRLVNRGELIEESRMCLRFRCSMDGEANSLMLIRELLHKSVDDIILKAI